MRLPALLFTAILTATAAVAQETQPSSPAQASSARPDNKDAKDDKDKPQERGLPVSIDKIRKELEQSPPQLLRGMDDLPTFKLEVKEKAKISLEDLIKSLDYKAGPVPAGGVYAAELHRQVFNPTNYPYMQPYSAFNTGELVTILVENLVGKYLAGKASNGITGAMRDRAVAAAHAEVEQAIADYCAAQPNRGAGIQICASSPASR